MNVQEDKPWPASPLGPAYSQQRHSPLPSPIHPSQHNSAAVQPPISSPPSAGDISHHYMSYYYSPHPHQQQSSQSYYSYYTDSRAPLRRADSSTHSTKPYYTSGFTMSSQPTTPRPSSSHSSPGNNPSSDETQPQPSSAQPQQQQEEVKPETTTIERPPALPSLTSPVHEQPTLPRGGGKMRTSRSSDNSVPRHPRQSSASYGVEESGPKFGATKYAGNVYAVDRTTVLDVRIQSKFDRGFFVADNDWTCYRRNYFQVSATFSIQGFPLYYHPAQHDAELGCLVRSDEDDQLHEVRGFLIGISARVADDDKSIPLIQHTAKRDKGPQCSPEPKPIRPGGDLNLLTRVSSSPGALLDQSVVTFERIQFKSATANNGKRRAAQQYYVLLVELYAKLASGRLVKVASNRSAQLVVRGRSPGHYSERNGKEEGSSETAGSSSAPTVLPSTNVHNNGDRGGGAAPSSIIPSADYYQAPPPPASSSYPYMNRDTNGNLPLVSPTFENGGMMRGGHDRSISAPSGPVDVYNHNGEQQHSDMNGYYKYAFYPRDHNPPPPSSSWGVHSRIASSGEPVSPYMAAPPPYYYNYYNSEHHQRSTSNNGAPLNSPGVYQGSSVPPSPYRSVSSQYEFPTNEQSPYHAQQSGGGNNFESTPQQEVKSSSAED